MVILLIIILLMLPALTTLQRIVFYTVQTFMTISLFGAYQKVHSQSNTWIVNQQIVLELPSSVYPLMELH